MVSLQEYEKITGYTPRPGEPCPECKAICASGGPDHHAICPLMAKLWAQERNPDAAIPAMPGVDPNDPKFGPWAAKLATALFSSAPPAIPKHITPPPPAAPAATPAPIAGA